MTLYLCLDQGGHASRALVLDECGAVLARAVREVPTQHRGADHVEQDPEQVVASLCEAVTEVVRTLGARAGEIVVAGLATQRSSIVCWDRLTGAALSPVLSWQDRRAHAWLDRFAPQADDIERRTGLKLSPHYGASKLRWCLDHLEPVRAAQRAERLVFGPLASFLVYRLTAEHSLLVDPSNAQRTLLFGLAARDWDMHLLELFGVPRAALPECAPTRHAFGHLLPGDLGLPLSVVVGDQAAALFAFGMPQADTAYVNLGTGAFVQRVMAGPDRVKGLLTGIASDAGGVPTYTLEGTVNGAGAALTWAAQALTLPDLEAQLPQWLARDGEVPLFLNGIGGLGAPFWLPEFESRFVGTGEPWQQAVAVAESIVFLLAINIERMQQAGALRALVVTGGLAVLDGLCQRLADLTGLPARRPTEHEATARGLAWLLNDEPTTWTAPDSIEFRPLPNDRLIERYRRWRGVMDAVRVDL